MLCSTSSDRLRTFERAGNHIAHGLPNAADAEDRQYFVTHVFFALARLGSMRLVRSTMQKAQVTPVFLRLVVGNATGDGYPPICQPQLDAILAQYYVRFRTERLFCTIDMVFL